MAQAKRRGISPRKGCSCSPTAEEAAPWIDTILRLWDDEDFSAPERRRSLAAAEAWSPERLLPRFEQFFARVTRSPCASPS